MHACMLGWWLRACDAFDGCWANFSVMGLSLTVFKYEKEQNSLHICEEGISLHCKDDSFFTTCTFAGNIMPDYSTSMFYQTKSTWTCTYIIGPLKLHM